MACLTQPVTDDTIAEAYNAMGMWIQSKGYRIVGPSREICQPLDQGDNTGAFLIEIQFPVEHENRLETAKAVLAPHDLTQLTERSRQALQFAREEAREFRHPAISVAHLLAGLMRERNSFAAYTLRDLGVTLDQARDAVTALVASECWPPQKPSSAATTTSAASISCLLSRATPTRQSLRSGDMWASRRRGCRRRVEATLGCDRLDRVASTGGRQLAHQ